MCGPYHSPLGVFSGTGPTADEKARAADVLRQAAEFAKGAEPDPGHRVPEPLRVLLPDHRGRRRGAGGGGRTTRTSGACTTPSTPTSRRSRRPAAIATVGPGDGPRPHQRERPRHPGHRAGRTGTRRSRRLQEVGYDGWLVIEAFGRALPDLAAATRVWRDLFPTPARCTPKASGSSRRSGRHSEPRKTRDAREVGLPRPGRGGALLRGKPERFRVSIPDTFRRIPTMPAVPLSQVAVHLRPRGQRRRRRPAIPAGADARTSTAAPSPCRPRSAWATSSPSARSKKGEAVQQVRPDHRLRQPGRSPPATTSTSTTSRPTPSSATTPSAATARRRRRRRPSAARSWATTAAPTGPTTSGTAPATTSPSSAPSTARPAPASTSPSGCGRPACSSDFPNVDGVVPITHKAGCAMQYDGPDHQPARPHPGRLRQAPERRRLHPDRPRLRDRPGHPPDRERGADPAQRADSRSRCVLTHPGVRRHRQDGRGRRARPWPSCCRGSTTCGGVPTAGQAPDPRHQLRRLRRQQRRDGQPGPRRRLRPARRSRAARASSARRRRSTGPSTC